MQHRSFFFAFFFTFP
ncbi:pheA operon leader peptide PheL [Entomohabitans teleogrylli]|nr:pheA operon leader peptide PheL [Entomohabitans teleogrylli]